jgi:hypothetical protein
MPAGRICAGEGCNARLSIYNSGELCALCVRGRERPLAEVASDVNPRAI